MTYFVHVHTILETSNYPRETSLTRAAAATSAAHARARARASPLFNFVLNPAAIASRAMGRTDPPSLPPSLLPSRCRQSRPIRACARAPPDYIPYAPFCAPGRNCVLQTLLKNSDRRCAIYDTRKECRRSRCVIPFLSSPPSFSSLAFWCVRARARVRTITNDGTVNRDVRRGELSIRSLVARDRTHRTGLINIAAR